MERPRVHPNTHCPGIGKLKGLQWVGANATHAIGEMLVARAGFEPAKLYAEDLESTPFDRSGTSPI